MTDAIQKREKKESRGGSLSTCVCVRRVLILPVLVLPLVVVGCSSSSSIRTAAATSDDPFLDRLLFHAGKSFGSLWGRRTKKTDYR